MDERVPSRGNSKVTLKDILMGCGQPISEEQAWALCYQCCCKLKQMAWRSRQVPALQGAENILIHQDGTVSFISCCDTRQNPQLENKLVERLGRVIYTALDWGLTSDLERALSEPLDNLLRHMLGLHTATIKPQIGFQDPVTLNNIIKVCAGRLFTPAEAGGHYRAVCRVHFAEHKEFCKLLLTIERSKRVQTPLQRG
ncbi:protein spire homolog 1-like [Ascaphus truei]|uniref:protein spire homolog 1-like n=1 Tax=Ascaphus truei TaxID=8439 RepID=UPI003F59EC4A